MQTEVHRRQPGRGATRRPNSSRPRLAAASPSVDASTSRSAAATRPRMMLRALAAMAVPWDSVHVFQVDERVAPPGDPARNLTQLHECLLAHVPLRPEQVHAMPVEQADLDAAARSYAAVLCANAGTPPVLDLVHLGLGVDGHTASLVPGDPSLEVTGCRGHARGAVPGPSAHDAYVPGHRSCAARAVGSHGWKTRPRCCSACRPATARFPPDGSGRIAQCSSRTVRRDCGWMRSSDHVDPTNAADHCRPGVAQRCALGRRGRASPAAEQELHDGNRAGGQRIRGLWRALPRGARGSRHRVDAWCRRAGHTTTLVRLSDPKSGISAAFVQAGTTSTAESPGLLSLGTMFYEPLWVFCRCPADTRDVAFHRAHRHPRVHRARGQRDAGARVTADEAERRGPRAIPLRGIVSRARGRSAARRSARRSRHRHGVGIPGRAAAAGRSVRSTW